MDKVLNLVLSFFTALGGVLGVQGTSSNVPDRPAIVAPTAVSTASAQLSEGTEIEISGIVQSIRENTLTISGITVWYNSNTRIRGELQVGARVAVEAVKRGNDIEARSVQVFEQSSSQASSTSSRSSSSTSTTASSSASSSESSRSSSSESSHASSSSSTSTTASSSASSSESSRSSSSESSHASSSSSVSTSASSSASSSESSRSSSSESSKSSGGSSSSSNK